MVDSLSTLDVTTFGRALVETGDLDPVYIALHGAKLSPDRLKRWLLAYWCFYHCGTSSWIVDQPDYWTAMKAAAATSEHPRGTERRHFRGELARKSVDWLSRFPGDVDYLFGGFTEGVQPKSLASVMKYVTTWVGFGDWIAFKVADMLERLGVSRITFTEADTFLFKAPREGAALVVQHYANGEHVERREEPEWAFRYLEGGLGHYVAPPRLERTLNGQEYETILCKWKSHLNGHYPLGKDLEEVRHGLLRYARCRTAQALLRGLSNSMLDYRSLESFL